MRNSLALWALGTVIGLAAIVHAQPATQPAALNISPTLVTLHAKDAEAEAVFKDLGKQGGCIFGANPPELWKAGLPKVTLDIDGQPFWTAVKELCTKAGVYPTYLERRKITVAQGSKGWLDGPSIVNGAFLVVASQAVRVDSLRFSDPTQKQRDLAIGFMAMPEPKLRVLRGTKHPKIDEVTDENGKSLATQGLSGDGLGSGGPFAWTVELKLPTAVAAKRIAKIRGSCRYAVMAAAEQWEIPNILTATNVTKTVGKRNHTVMEVKKETQRGLEQVSVQVTLSGPARDGESVLQVMHPAFLDVVDGAGRPLALRGWTRILDKTPPEYVFHFLTKTAEDEGAAPGEATKLVWEIPTGISEVVVPF